ncbi:PE family protein [Mycolicibacterium helvum]|uniref:Cell motility protein n=1 Tax=Mycolicibacterium helvum TaxID=1534349 RepID=A0A7I7T9B7_9MYCO|nr:PE family protein [Mycolicibacterium helvum]BBY65580.1 cell motility protein [Mycolicibacterium helvum]
MTLRIVPEGLMAAGAAVEALTARLAATQTAAAPLISAVIPPAADAVSLQAAANCAIKGAAHVAAAGDGVLELGRAGAGVEQSAISYAVADSQAAVSYGVRGS